MISSTNNLRKKPNRGYTIIELTVVVLMVAIIVGIAVAALRNSKSDSGQKGAEGSIKSISDAILRAKLAGDEDPRIIGEEADDIEAAVEYLQSKGYIQ